MIKAIFSVANAATAVTVAEQAGAYFDQGHNCAQAVLLAHAGQVDPALLEIAKSFGAGIAGAKCLCGAVSGGVMALSLAGAGKQSHRLVEAFRHDHRTTCCAGLSKAFAWKSKQHRQNCRRLTVSAAAITARILRAEKLA